MTVIVDFQNYLAGLFFHLMWDLKCRIASDDISTFLHFKSSHACSINQRHLGERVYYALYNDIDQMDFACT